MGLQHLMRRPHLRRRPLHYILSPVAALMLKIKIRQRLRRRLLLMFRLNKVRRRRRQQ